MPRDLESYLDALMCEADDLYFAMQEAIGNRPLMQHYADQLCEKNAIFHAMLERMDGATVN